MKSKEKITESDIGFVVQIETNAGQREAESYISLNLKKSR